MKTHLLGPEARLTQKQILVVQNSADYQKQNHRRHVNRFYNGTLSTPIHYLRLLQFADCAI